MHTQKFVKITLGFAIVAGIMGLARFSITGYDSYLWLNWNLLLALLPIFFAWLATHMKRNWQRFILVLAWLMVLPNAPYLLTDFIHMADVGPRSFLWYDGSMIFMYCVAGLAAWAVSLDILKRHFKWQSWLIVLVAFISGFGVYLGRYLRFNSWEVISHPLPIMETIGNIILDPVAYEPVILMTLVYTIILSLCYFSLQFLQSSHEKTKA